MIKHIFKSIIAVSVAVTFSVYADTTVSAADCKTLLNTNPSSITAADQATLKECIKHSKCSDEKLSGIPDCARQLSRLYAVSAVNQAMQAANAVSPTTPTNSSAPTTSGSTTPENSTKPAEKNNTSPASILPPGTVAGMGVKKSPKEYDSTKKTDTKNKAPKDNINWL